MDEVKIDKPIGDFIIKHGKGIETPNGFYYHYSDVCQLLKEFKRLGL